MADRIDPRRTPHPCPDDCEQEFVLEEDPDIQRLPNNTDPFTTAGLDDDQLLEDTRRYYLPVKSA